MTAWEVDYAATDHHWVDDITLDAPDPKHGDVFRLLNVAGFDLILTAAEPDVPDEDAKPQDDKPQRAPATINGRPVVLAVDPRKIPPSYEMVVQYDGDLAAWVDVIVRMIPDEDPPDETEDKTDG